MRQISPNITASSDLRTRFDTARPFRHLVLDGFLTPDFADRLLAEFPDFERGNARNEQGELGGKSVVERIRELGGAYAELDDLIRSEPFLAWLSASTGIADLRYDPMYFGGGTHENRQGQELDPHIDFNRHPSDGSHRRLNLIIYLNRTWEDSWGGSLELHSDPASERNRIQLLTPSFNRCVVFETTEWSWHGFSRIALPPDRQHLSRKSIALYFYTRDRPSHELAPTHSTQYVERPLPGRFQPGYQLDEGDVLELKSLLARRDQHLARIYDDLKRQQDQLDRLISGRSLSRSGRAIQLGWHALQGSRQWLGHLLRYRRLDSEAFASAFRPFVSLLPERIRTGLLRLWRQRSGRYAHAPASGNAPLTDHSTAQRQACAAPEDVSYAKRLEEENAIFADQTQVHDLPAIFHYWSNTYLLPMELQFGFRHPEDFFAKFLHETALRTARGSARFVSLGAGNCDAEVRIAAALCERGFTDFTLECIDINPQMLERGREYARSLQVDRQVIPVLADFNRWQPPHAYDAIMANQSLHHVQDLEALFDRVRSALKPDGRFVVSDMIGRNGHQRWPEAKAIVDEFWSQLPESYRYNLQLRRMESVFLDWDCSVSGFEGIRAQDILPLLRERFGFELFLAFGNVIDPFIDRSFGHHFSPEREWDRAFIDRVHARDEQALAEGIVKPTHMMAVMGLDRTQPTRHRGNLTPEFCQRTP